MTNRPLTDEERALYQLSVAKNSRQIELLEYDLESKKLRFERGLRLSYEEQMKLLEKEIHQTEQELEKLRFVLNDSHDKLANGVPPKKPIEE